LILSVCVVCSLAVTWNEKSSLELLKREIELRMLERELEREHDVRIDDALHELDARYLAHEPEMERVFKTRQVIQGCIQGDLIFVVDSSGSIGIDNWRRVLDFINNIIDQVGVAPQGTHVGLVTYGNRAHIQFNLNNFTDAAQMKAAVSLSKFLDENTNTSGGIATALRVMFTKENGDRDKAPNIMVIITDGVSTYDNATTIPNAQAAKSANILLVSVGVGNLTSQSELEGIASAGKDGKPIVLKVDSYEALDLVKTQLANVACDTDETPCPGTSCKNVCKFGFNSTADGCATCQCLPQQKICP